MPHREETLVHLDLWVERTGRPIAADWTDRVWDAEPRTARLQLRLEPTLLAELRAEAERRKPPHRHKASVSNLVRYFCIAGLIASTPDPDDDGYD